MESTKSVEAEGSTIDEAIENALRELGADRERVEIEIMSDATRGILGIGKKKARVRASLRAPLAASLGSSRSSSQPEPEKAGGTSHRRRLAEKAADDPEEPAAGTEPTPATEAAAHGRQALEELLRRMGFVVEVRANGRREDGAIELSICGEESGLLIGRHGQTLDALEYLVGRITFRGEEAKQRIVLECGSYRRDRRAALEQMALKLGERAKRRGKAVTMEAMSPRDRRVVHMALRDYGGVTTRSVGDGYYRKLRIIPAGDRRRDRF